MKKLLPLIYLFLQTACIAQFDYPPAVEKWSEPVRLDSSFSIKMQSEIAPCLTRNQDTIYYFLSEAIYTSHLVNGVWQSPIKLNSYVNNDSPMRTPSLSKNGKRLYYSSWGGYGGWDLWYNDWDSVTNDWGPYHNMGPVINSGTGEHYLYEVSKDTIYIIDDKIAPHGVSEYIRNNNTWAKIDSFYYHPLGSGYIYGLSITEDRKKLYFAQYLWDTLDTELAVCYWDEQANTWGSPKFLNINTKASHIVKDSSTGIKIWVGGSEDFPWISADGKTLYFNSNRDIAITDSLSIPDIYVSHLIVDENGDSVMGVRDYREENIAPKTAVLYPCYPNPFNPSTKISFELPKESYVKLLIYNLLGEKIETLISEYKRAGAYDVKFDALTLSSGVYFYILQTNGTTITKKMLLLK